LHLHLGHRARACRTELVERRVALAERRRRGALAR